MSDHKHAAATDTGKPAHAPIPEYLPAELLPLYDWWKANGSQLLFTLAAVIVVAGGVSAVKHARASKAAGANQELLSASSLDELENTVSKYGSTKVGNAARLRLAKAYYDASKYEDALGAYETCLRKGAPAGFKEVAELGRAHALEGLGRLDDALAAYQAFEKAQPSHFLLPQAVMGAARVLTLQGKKGEAKALLENLKAQKTGEAAWEMAIANLEGVVDRYEPRAVRSLFEAADEAPIGSAPPTPPPAAAP
jgi:predicted negative regulator of RcsB-dependent stress response